jgi:UDP-N-acetylmuramoyl-L-alanyl-D-glutamate--2,6-diaminopimelate ligase
VISLAGIANELGLRASGDATILGIEQDSRAVKPGDLFVARKGEKHDGTRFVAQALKNGAAAVLGGPELNTLALAIPTIIAADVPDAFARAAACIYGHPSRELGVLGITGTNGKTTTAHVLADAVNAAKGNEVVGVIGTVGHHFRTQTFPTKHTTPEPDELARVLRAMQSAGSAYVAMEVSSIALSARRVEGTHFRAAAFTNLTQDHLDFHGTMGAYGEAKARLFLELKPDAACINIGDPFGRALAARVSVPVVRVSASADDAADIAVESSSFDRASFGVSAQIRALGKTYDFRSSMLGKHNLENTVVALGVVHALGLSVQAALDGIARGAGVPGRLERCDIPGVDDVRVVVDYAHTPDALVRVLEAVRSVCEGRVLCVFGCGGDRDAGKRGPMGAAVARLADVAIITDDNPRSEDPKSIVQPIADAVRGAGLSEGATLRGQRHVFRIEHDREKAIHVAIANASAKDVVVIAGKGHETYQIVGENTRHFDDREVARAALLEDRWRRQSPPIWQRSPGTT